MNGKAQYSSVPHQQAISPATHHGHSQVSQASYSAVLVMQYCAGGTLRTALQQGHFHMPAAATCCLSQEADIFAENCCSRKQQHISALTSQNCHQQQPQQQLQQQQQQQQRQQQQQLTLQCKEHQSLPAAGHSEAALPACQQQSSLLANSQDKTVHADPTPGTAGKSRQSQSPSRPQLCPCQAHVMHMDSRLQHVVHVTPKLKPVLQVLHSQTC